MRVENVEEWGRAHERLFEYEQGHAYAMPATLQDALAVDIPRNLVASWLFYCEKHPPLFPIRHFVWDIRRLVDGNYEFAEEWLAPVLTEWSDSEDVATLWADADRPYEDGKDVPVLRALASLYHQEDDEGGLWVLLPDGDEGDPVEVEAIKHLHRLFYELDSAEIEQLEIAAGVTNPAALAAMRAKGLLTLTEADLATLAIRDRLRIENEIMMARYEAQKALPSPADLLGPLPDHPELPIQQAEALSDFWAHIPSGKIIHGPSRGLWNAGSVDKHLGRIKDAMKTEGPGMLASVFLSKYRPVQGMGWDPSQPMIVEGRMLTDNGWIRAAKCRTFNTYLPADIEHRAGDVAPFVDHVRFVYPDEWQHIVNYLAFKVQRPGDKINHGLVFIGAPGIGKDTILEPAIVALGPHNFKSIGAASFFKSDFNGYLQSVMLRIDEVHDLGGESKYAFHDRTKTILAAPPMGHRINEKFVPEHFAVNINGVVLTSNHPDALYLPRDDRRHFVCVSPREQDDFPQGYFDRLYEWFAKGGNEAVAHYLANLDLSGFNAKAPPPKTAGWHMIVAAGIAPESGDMTDAIEAMGNPPALTVAGIKQAIPGDSPLRAMLDDVKFRKAIPKRLADCGYVAVANPEASSGRWRMGISKTSIYGRKDITETQRLEAARLLAASASTRPPIPER